MCGGVLVKVDTTVGKLSEGSLLLDLGGLNGVLYLKTLAFVRLVRLDQLLHLLCSALLLSALNLRHLSLPTYNSHHPPSSRE